MDLMITLSLLLNIAVLVPVCGGLLANAKWAVGGLGILAREPVFRQTIVHDHDLGLAELLSKRLDESMAGPRPMNGLDAKGNVLNGYSCFHVSPRVKEFASKFDGMAIVFETLRAAFDMHDRVQWCDVAVERNERVVEGLLKVLCSAAHDFTHHVQRWRTGDASRCTHSS